MEEFQYKYQEEIIHISIALYANIACSNNSEKIKNDPHPILITSCVSK